VTPDDPRQTAKAARLRYVSDDIPGIRRKRSGRGFVYYDPEGNRITDPDELERIRALAIPPAWTDVWICPFPNGHIQATGRDAKGRKQYRYHERWGTRRNRAKFDRMLAFGAALPHLRARLERDLALPGLPREKVLATIVKLMDTTFIRVGNVEYARANQSYGLTTLRDKHVAVSGSKIHFKFRGKSGKEHVVDLQDKRLARIIQRSRDLPGQELFQYIDESGNPHDITSSDVNDYLREATGEDFTAKDFRTWGGTLLALMTFHELEPGASKTRTKRNITHAVKQVAEQLGNTVAISRKYYIHPAVIEAYQDGSFHDTLEQCQAKVKHTPNGLQPEECLVIAFLERMSQIE
jgi:DNA topoisomerase-1